LKISARRTYIVEAVRTKWMVLSDMSALNTMLLAGYDVLVVALQKG